MNMKNIWNHQLDWVLGVKFCCCNLKTGNPWELPSNMHQVWSPPKKESHWMTPTDFLWFPKGSIRLPTKILDLLAKNVNKTSPPHGGLSWQTHGSSSVRKSPKISPSKVKTSSEFTWIFILHDQLKGAVNWVKDSKGIGQDFRQPQEFSQIVLSPKTPVGSVVLKKTPCLFVVPQPNFNKLWQVGVK